MRVSLFGLFLRGTNLMEPWPKPVQSNLPVSDFTSDFRFYGYYYICCSYPALPLVSYSTSLLILSYHTASTSCLISLIMSTFSCMLLLTTRFSMYDYDSVLSIHICLSQHAIWLLYHHSPGSFIWLPWILMSRSWSLEHVGAWSVWILPVADQSGAAEAWIPSRPSEALSFQAPLCASRVFLL